MPTGGAKQGRGGRDDADGGNHRRDGRTAAEKVDLGSDTMLEKNDSMNGLLRLGLHIHRLGL